jgi:acetyl esterase/lipase
MERDEEFEGRLASVEELITQYLSRGLTGLREFSQTHSVGSLALQPFPKTVSEEVMAGYRAKRMFTWDFSTPQAVAMTQKNAVDFARSLSEPSKENFLESVEETEFVGVPVVIATPKGYDAQHDDKITLFIHGGGGVLNDHRFYHMISAPVCHQMGVKCCSIGYRLAPQHPFPAGLDDCLAVYEYVINELGYAPQNVTLFGDSAGGGLIESTLQCAKERGLPMPRAIALISPQVDISITSDSLITLDGADCILGLERNVKAVWKAYAGEVDPRDPRISPIYYKFDASHPPVYIISGTRDLLLSDSARLQRKLREAGVEVKYDVFEGMAHDFPFTPSLPESQTAVSAISAFLSEKL